MGTADPRGVLAFLVGMAGAVLVGGKRSGQAVSAERDRGIAWLTVASVAAGLCIGLCLFGVWYWQASPVERVDAGWDAGMFVGFGLFAGTAAAVVVILLGLGVRSRGPG